VLAHGHRPRLRALGVPAHGRGNGVVPAVEQFAHEAREHRIAGGLRNQHVELPVGIHRRLAGRRQFSHAFHHAAQAVQGRRRELAGGQHDHGALDRDARLHQLRRAFAQRGDGMFAACAAAAVRVANVHARAHANLDLAAYFQRDQRLAQRRTRHAQLLRQLPLGRQTFARRKFALADQCEDLRSHGLVKPLGFCLFHRRLVSERFHARTTSVASGDGV
jgi:hypothetical protein